MSRRTAVFVQSPTPRPGFVKVDLGDGYAAFVAGKLCPAGVGLREVLDHVDRLFPEHRDASSDLCLMNGHFVRKQRSKKSVHEIALQKIIKLANKQYSTRQLLASSELLDEACAVAQDALEAK